MRKVTFGVASSLDNFIARADGSVDWLRWSDDAAAVMSDYWKRVDTVVIGRKTYEFAAAHGGGKPAPGVRSYVVSRTLSASPRPDVELVAEDPAGFVRQLKGGPGGEICIMGGGVLAGELLREGVIDEIGLNIHPVLLGSGVPLFHPMERQLDLELLEARPLAQGCVLATYRVAG